MASPASSCVTVPEQRFRALVAPPRGASAGSWRVTASARTLTWTRAPGSTSGGASAVGGPLASAGQQSDPELAVGLQQAEQPVPEVIAESIVVVVDPVVGRQHRPEGRTHHPAVAVR